MNRAFLIFAMTLVICSCKDPKQKNVSNALDSAETLEQKGQGAANIEHYIVDAIIDHYKQQEVRSRMQIELNDSMLHFVFFGMLAEDTAVQDSFYHLSADIPLYKNKYLSGDLNNDGDPELVVSVNTEGAGGGNLWWNDVFCFTIYNGKYKLIDVTPSGLVSGCDQLGTFMPKVISNGSVHSTSLCYAEDDGHCCPSLHYNVKVGLVNNKLVFKERKFLEREKYGQK